ncbi:MAG TPA: HU family DNA-binding protein [Gemmataceae bacterium]|nr:HU family DNA-binding protein [Gemmataceae bacterium]
MQRRHVLASTILLGSLFLVVQGGTAQLKIVQGTPPPQDPKKELTLTQRLAQASKLSEENADKFFQALGPVIREELRRGKEVSIPGLGQFRVVRVQEHRDLQNGRPVVIPASNTVEFLAEGSMADAVNTPGVPVSDTVVPFHYIPLPGQTPGQKIGNLRTPPTRTK